MQLDLSYFSILLQSIFVAVVIVLAVFAWRWLRVALDRGELAAQGEALAQVALYAKIFVAAAEQTMQKQPGFARLTWVLDQFDDVLPDVDKNLIRSFVEAAVSALPADPPPVIVAPPTTGTAGYVTTSITPAPADVAPPATSHSHRTTRTPARTEG